MKKTAKRLISLLLVVVMVFSMFATEVAAWSSLSHVNSADLILLELQRSAKQNAGNAKVTVYAPYDNHSAGNTFAYTIPQEYQEAIFSYPDAFRAGSLGPDFYPDMVTGQMYTHPYFTNPVDQSKVESGEWITLLCESVNRLPKNSDERKQALAFTLGYMLHFCGDLFGHDFVNTFSGGTYPSYSNVDILNPYDAELNNIVSHMSEESYMDSFVNSDFYKKNGYLGVDAPIRFIADTMLFNGSANSGAAPIFRLYGEVPYQYEYLIALRMEIYNWANEKRESLDPFVAMCVSFCDHWVEDIDNATYALVECFNNIAERMVTGEKNPLIEQEKAEEEAEGGGPSMMDQIMDECFGELSEEADNSTLTIIKEEIGYWLDNYGSYATPIPDIFFDGVPYVDEIIDFILKAIGIGFVFEAIEELIKLIVKEIIVYALQEYLPELKEISVALPGYLDKVTDPSRQLDSKYNPFKPAENNFAEFKEYIDKYAAEQQLLSNTTSMGIINGMDSGVFDTVMDSEFEAFYNTMVMFKLVLMGPDNFRSFIKTLTGKDLPGFTTQTTNIEATSLKLDIRTSDFTDAGTDDNIFVEVYQRTGKSKKRLIRKLLDKSGYNDFEAGDNDSYDVELPYPVKISELEVYIKQEDTYTAAEGWMCENITITPMHANVELIEPIGVGGNLNMSSGSKWNLDFQGALNERDIEDYRKQNVTTVALRITTSTVGSTPGTNSDVYLKAYNGSTEWASVLLDKVNYDDFESGDSDVYVIPIEKYDKYTEKMQGVPLDKLTLKIVHAGSDEWVVANVDAMLFNGNLPLTKERRQHFVYKKLKNEEIVLSNMKNINLPDKYLEKYSKPELSYETAVNDKLLSFVNSIDGGEQWADYENVLWSDVTIRKNVFFNIFKGFRPEVEYIATNAVAPGDEFDATVNLKGMWNGVREERRNAVADFADMAPVNGTIQILVVDKDKNVRVSRTKSIADNKAVFNDISTATLGTGYYDVKITYTPDANRPMYAGSTEVITDALYVTSELNFKSQDPAMPSGKNSTTLDVTVGETKTFTFDNEAPSAGFKIEKSGTLTGNDANVKFSGSPAKLTYTFTKEGVYTLTEILTLKQGSKVVGTKTHTFHITVDKPRIYPVITKIPKDVTNALGDNVTLSAAANNAVGATWYMVKTDGTTEKLGTNFVSASGTATTKITRAASKNALHYYCTFVSSDNSIKSTGNITVCFAPAVTSDGNVTADIGSTAFLKVTSDRCGHYSTNAGWYRNDIKLTAGSKYYPMGDTLAIQNIDATDAGTYTYKCSNSHGVTVSANVTLSTKEAAASNVISTFEITGLDKRVTVGDYADTEVSVSPNAKYTVESVKWQSGVDSNNIAYGSNGYVHIKLKAKSGYTFKKGDILGYIDGINKWVYSVPSGATEITVSVDYSQTSSWQFAFPVSDPISITTVSLTFMQGVAADGQKLEGTYSCPHGDLPATSMHHTGDIIYSLAYVYGSDNVMPDGLTLNSDGTITGTPTTGGVYTVKIAARSGYSSGSGYVDKEINIYVETKASHTHSTKIISNTATCTTAGLVTFECGCTSAAPALAPESGHVYDNACDKNCNRCNASRSASGHSYTDDCDETCNECGSKRSVDTHVYSFHCDPDCNKCGTVREVIGHMGGTATCTEKAKCTACGEYYGETKEHDYSEATCTAPMTCKDCGTTAGGKLGHAGGIATCTEKAKCVECGEYYGDLLSHDYSDATCKEPATCKVCGTVDGTKLYHTGGTATCTEKAKCTLCGEKYGELLEHIYDNACDNSCNVCGTIRSVPNHIYDNDRDEICNVCGASRSVVVYVNLAVVTPNGTNIIPTVSGAPVGIATPQIAGSVFSHWSVSGATVADAGARETIVIMGETDATATANYNNCSCNCHGNVIQKLIFKLTNIFAALLNPAKKICACGAGH